MGYVTNEEPSNIDLRLLVDGSKNMMIDAQKKARVRPGYSVLGALNTSITPVRNAWTWNTSTGTHLPQKFYDDELEVYLGTIDTAVINAYKRVRNGWSTTEKLRVDTVFDATENLDLQLGVIGDDNLYEWNGAVAVANSITTTTIVKKSTTTFAQNRFYTTRNKVLINERTGVEYTYTGGETTTTLTGVTPDPTGDIVDGDVLIQKVVTNADEPAANRTNDTIYVFENQVCLGSEDDEEVHISKNTSITDYSFSAPRVPGEGAVLTLDNPTRAISSIGKNLLVFSGRSSIFRAEYHELDIGGTLTETLEVRKLDIGIDQGALNADSVVPVGEALAYLSNEVALRLIQNPDDLEGIQPKTLSNPIKPDFDAETWFDSNNVPDAFGFWYKNMLIFTAPQTSRMYQLNFIEDADGRLFRFWNPPQILPIGAMAVIDSGDGPKLHGHSNAVPETYLMFDGQSDRVYSSIAAADKLPIHAIAKYAFNNYGERAALKNFDLYYVEGEITPNVDDLTVDIDYDRGETVLQEIIDGTDDDILEGSVQFNSLAQQSLAINPLGGLLNPPSNARYFKVEFEEAREDFNKVQITFSSNAPDYFWAIIAHGSNAALSRRQTTNVRK